MKVIRAGAVLVIIAALGITGTITIKQHMRIRGLGKSQRRLAAQNQWLSVSNASLLSDEAAQSDELVRLRRQPPEVLKLRSQLTQAWQQLAAATNQSARAESTNESAGYLSRDQLKFAGFDTPENGFQSLIWAGASGDYTNWLAALTPASQEEELADPRSLELFQRGANSGVTGWQVLASKPVGNDRVELKVRMETENSMFIFIYPMVAVGNEWKLGDELEPYTQAWDSPSGAQ